MTVVANQEISRLGDHAHLTLDYRPAEESVWYALHARPRPCFTPGLLADIAAFQNRVESLIRSGDLPVSYLVPHSRVPGVFNLGLGIEAALSSAVLIAGKGSELGLPEILFNLFPGMGAYSLLSRKLDARRTEKLITAGRLYSAEALFEMGVVDVLAEPGEGEAAVVEYIRLHRRAANGRRAITRVREYLNSLTDEELIDIAEIRVDASLSLTDRDLRLMSRLVGARNRLKVSSRAAIHSA